MATKRPSYLKRQKEQKRTARASEKREARRERKQAKSMGSDPLPEMESTAEEAGEKPVTDSEDS
jgi:hypothetical protein